MKGSTGQYLSHKIQIVNTEVPIHRTRHKLFMYIYTYILCLTKLFW